MPPPLFLAPFPVPLHSRRVPWPPRPPARHACRPLHRRRARATLSAAPSEGVPAAATAPAPGEAVQPAPAPAPTAVQTHDVAVIGAGPAGLSLSAALCRRGVSVACLDGAIDAPWPNHYGVWKDEFDAVGLADCATAVYPTTAVYAGDEKTVLQRAYLRVDRVKLKERLMQRCHSGGVRLCKAFVKDVRHVTEFESELQLAPAGGGCEVAGVEVGTEEGMLRARVVVDCTGHSLRFTEAERSARFQKPWAQAAYGIEAEVERHPYQVDQMLLMDFRDKHMCGAALEEVSEARPTFLYVFPTSRTRAFFEETSVIAPTAVPFEELKERLYRRLAHDGVRVTRVVEEEFSLIPMGGSLPRRAQRVIGFGGAAGLVHPATGYMVARTVGMADTVAETIARGVRGGVAATRVSEEVWEATWGLGMRRQRDFLAFGAELLGALSMDESRRFFRAFFQLPQHLWGSFLGFGLDGPADRVFFALHFFAVASNPIRVGLLRGMVQIGKWRLVRSVLPLWLSGMDESQ